MRDEDLPRIGLAKKREDDDVPKIGRGKLGFKVPLKPLFTISMTIITLIVVLAMRKPCSQGVANFFKNYEAPVPADAGDVNYILLPPPVPTPPQPAPSPSPSPSRSPTPSTPSR